MSKSSSRSAMAILLFILLLPALCMLPVRSKLEAHTELHRAEVLDRKARWEERFNLGAMVIFPTAMLWILLVVPVVLLREGQTEKA